MNLASSPITMYPTVTPLNAKLVTIDLVVLGDSSCTFMSGSSLAPYNDHQNVSMGRTRSPDQLYSLVPNGIPAPDSPLVQFHRSSSILRVFCDSFTVKTLHL
jgi:hypothetical protein